MITMVYHLRKQNFISWDIFSFLYLRHYHISFIKTYKVYTSYLTTVKIYVKIKKVLRVYLKNN